MRASLGKGWWLLLPAISGIVGCAHGPATASGAGATEKSHLEISILETPDQSEAARAAWAAYGLGRAKEWSDREGTTRNDSGDDFSITLSGLRLAAAVWKRGRQETPDAQLDLLLEVEAGGFLEEFAVLVLSRPGWTVPPEALKEIDFQAFKPWALERLQGRPFRAGATTTPKNGKRWPDVPGADLPVPEALMTRGEENPCVSARALKDAVRRWQAEERRIDGLPIAAANRQDFLTKLDSVRGDRDFQSKGATWVDMRVGMLHFFAGFCANEREEWEEARRALEGAVLMLPTEVTVRGEIAHTYLKQRKPDRAMAHLEVALRLTDDPCHLARTWRKIGFARFEQGQLAQARTAYETSLAYEPENPIALKELALIRDALGRGGGQDTAASTGFDHAPQVTTRCGPAAETL